MNDLPDTSICEDIERESPARIAEVQERLFAAHMRHLAEGSPYYRELFASLGIRPHDMRLSGLSGLPLTGKADIESRNGHFLAVPQAKIRDIVLSSGTTGAPIRVMYTAADLARIAFNEKTAMTRIGIGPGDVVLLTCTLDRCFIAGLAYYEGVRAAGAAAIRSGLAAPESHREVIRRMRPTVIIGVPSFLHKLACYLRSRGDDPARLGVRALLCIGEPVRGAGLGLLARGAELETLYGAPAYSTYASSETITSACECTERRGGHIHPALGVVEIIDENGSPLPAGEAGEAVFTPFAVEGMPLLRYRTGDVSYLLEGDCACGRSGQRLGPILGRKRQLIKLHGTSLYPQAIFSALEEIEGVGEYYVLVSDDGALSDRVEVHLSLRDPSVTAHDVSERLRASLRVRPVVFTAPEEEVRALVYSDHNRKPVRFIDRRGA